MFSGIVEEIGTVHEVGSHHLTVRCHLVMSDCKVSDSISVSGVCLTVANVIANGFRADVMPETLRRTNLGLLAVGDLVNLERAVTPSTRLGGHIVLGHADGVGRIASVTGEESATIVTVQAPHDIMRYVAMKGSVTVDGVSLTVAGLAPDSFTVSLVPYTSHQTTLGSVRPGRVVNLEVDVLARYIERLQDSSAESTGITWDLLQELGY